MTTTFTKSTAEVYLFEGLPRGGWAKFTVQDMGTKGRISIASDYGDWQNGWSACGEGFKAFLCGLDIGYVAGKFGVNHWLDLDGTIKQLKVDVLEARKFSMSKETARQLWDEIKSLDGVLDSQFHIEIIHCNALMSRYDGTPPVYTDIHPLFRRFWAEAWPLFIAELKKEISVLEVVT